MKNGSDDEEEGEERSSRWRMIRSCRKTLRALRTGVVGVRWHWKGAGDEPNILDRENFFLVSEEAEDEEEEDEEESKLLED